MQKLNYYSRYNRIKSPRKINTLYHLIQDLNLQAIVTDDLIERVTKLRDAQQQARLRLKQERKQKQRNKKANANLNNNYNSKESDKTLGEPAGTRGRMLDQKEDQRRVASYDKNHIKSLIPEELLQSKFQEEINKKSKPVTDRSKRTSEANRSNRSNQKSHRSNRSNKNSSRKQSHNQNINEQQTPFQSKSIMQQENEQSPTRQKIDPQPQPQTKPEKPQQHSQIPTQPHQPPQTAPNQKTLPQPHPHPQKQTPSQSQIILQGSQTIQADAYTNIRDHQKQELFKSNFDAVSQGIAELKKVDQRNSSFVNCQQEGKDISDMGCRSEKLYRLFGSDIQVQGTDREDQISINKSRAAEDNVKLAQVIPIVKKTFQASPESDVQKQQHQYEHDYEYEQQYYEGEEQGSPADELEGQQQENQQKYIENRRQILILSDQLIKQQENQYNQNGIFAKNEKTEGSKKIPFKGLSEGKWPEAETQKSIQGIGSSQISAVPSTLIQKSSQNIIGEKQRKPFKKMMMDKKLHPRMVTSTIVNDQPVKKVNFKKMIKKQSLENKKSIIEAELTPEKKRKMFIKPAEEKKNLLKAFFDLN